MSYQIRPATPADYPGIAAIVNAQMKEPTSVAALERQEQLRRPEHAYLRLVATDAGTAAPGPSAAATSGSTSCMSPA